MTLQKYTDIKCDKCDNGWLYIKDDMGNDLARKCECMKRRENIERIKRCGVEIDTLNEMSFEKYECKHDWQKVIKGAVSEYAQRVICGDTHEWMMICGQVGSGKTHIATAAMSEIMQAGISARYMSWRDISRYLQGAIFDAEAYDKRLRTAIEVRVLYIDDFFRGEVKSADINAAFDIINGRYMRRNKTIITSEKSYSDIMRIDEAIGSRIYQMTNGNYHEIGHDVTKNERMK